MASTKKIMSTNELGLWIPPDGVDDFTLPVNHAIQNNNTGGEGYRECFMTSCTMLADHVLRGELTRQAQEQGLREPEDVYFQHMDGDTTDAAVHIRALARMGINAYFSTTASLNDVSHSLYRGIPVPCGMAYKASGHWVLINGRDPQGFDVLCPYGIRNGASNTWTQIFRVNADASPDSMSWSLLKQIFVDLGPEAGWSIFCTKVKGISTGVKAGM